MKRILTYLAFAAAALTMVSCNQAKTRKALLPNISGKAGEVIVVIEKSYWEGSVGMLLRDTLARDCDFLPQKEPMFNLVDVAPAAFNKTSMFQVHRNILMVNISSAVTEPGVVFQKDLWAAPQTVIRINAIDSESAIQLIQDNFRKIETTLEQAERDRIISNSKKYEERGLAPVVTQLAGGSPHFPSGYKLKKRTNDFIWITYDTQYVQQSILAYKYPVVEGENMMDLDNILANTNEMLKNNVPGMFENTYMTTSEFARPSIKYMKYKGLDFAEIRGFWEVYNDYMGGPFVSHVFYSQDGQDMIVLQGFVYAPKYDKRQYLRQVESIIYSFEWAEPEKE
ncbi:MAG: DUF4837 family protein [Bacteroidales bacterium]|nr:DUF4837 family protein [Bacteroidales bacterium]